MSKVVSFRRMEDGTKEDYDLLDESERKYAAGLPGRILQAVRKLDHSLEGYPVSRLGHSLQTATRALRDGADDELACGSIAPDDLLCSVFPCCARKNRTRHIEKYRGSRLSASLGIT